MRFFLEIKRSVIAFVVTLALGFFSMGALGAALYYLGYPVFAPFYGDLNTWSGDWVWSATLWAGMLWSVSFLVAGWLNLRLEQRGTGTALRRAIYVGVLWLGAIGVWMILLASTYEPSIPQA